MFSCDQITIDAQFNRTHSKEKAAQGTIEYLVIIAIIVVISLLAAGLATGFFSSGSQAVKISQDLGGRIGSGGISVLEGVSDTNGDAILRLKNSTGESFSINKISGLSGGTSVIDKHFNNALIPGGGEVNLSMDNLTGACVCGATDTRKICEFEITLTSQNGLEKKQRISKSVDCVSNTTPTANVVNSFRALWAQGPAIGSGASTEQAYSIFSDSGGSVYVAGSFTSTTLGFGNGVTLTNRGSTDFFVVKYNSSGVAQWAQNPVAGKGTGSDSSLSVFVDTSGNVYVSGQFDSNIGFGNDINLTNRGSYDFFVVKYNSNGVAQWAQGPATGTGTSSDYGDSVFVDTSGNVYLGGDFFSTPIGFGNDINLTNRSNSDIFIVKYNSSGIAQWAQNPAASTSNDFVSKIFMDSSGNIYITGNHASSTLSFGNDVNLTNRGGYDFYVVKYNNNGVAQWARGASVGTGTNTDTGRSVFVDTSGNVYVAGDFISATLGFGNSITLTRQGGNNDFFVVKYDPDGNALWAKNPSTGTGTSTEYCDSVFVDSSGNVYLSGISASTILDFGNGVGWTNRINDDFFIAKYNSSGIAQWVKTPLLEIGTNNDEAYSVFVDASGNVYSTGNFDNNIGFGNNVTLTNRGSADFFVVKYGYQ